jgi:hypothetical protein
MKCPSKVKAPKNEMALRIIAHASPATITAQAASIKTSQAVTLTGLKPSSDRGGDGSLVQFH